MNLSRLAGIVLAGIVICFSWAGFCFAEDLVVTMMDVGQADAILIQTADKTVLIDAGEDKELTSELLAQKGIRQIDLLVATHPHSDHIGGMKTVVEKTSVIKLYMDNGFPHTTKMYDDLMDAVESRVASGATKYLAARVGRKLNLGKEAQFEVLWPDDNGLEGTRSDINANSIVMKLTHGDVCFLLMGDAEAETEQKVAPLVNKCQILKVSHHGSPHSSIPELLDKAKPEVGLISCGLANKHGHPGQSTLDALSSGNAKTYRTDWQGEIKVVSNGKTYSVTTEKNLSLSDLPCIDVNRGTAEDFGALKGVGKITIDRIMDARASNINGFQSVQEFLAALPHDTAHRLEKLTDYLSVNCAERGGKYVAGIPAVPNNIAPMPSEPAPAPVAVMPSPAQVAAAPNPGMVNINIAGLNELAGMPGMSASKAQAAIDYRNTHGPYKSCQELTNVKGIGAKTVEKLLSVCVAEGGAAAAAAAPAAPAMPAPVTAQAVAQTTGNSVNINIASANELAGMPGMSASKAAAAIEFRNANGPFATCHDLQKVKGIGVKTVEKLLSVCTVE